MKGGHEGARAILVRLAPQLGDPFPGPEQRLRGEVAEGQDHQWLDGVELRHQERVARRDLVRLRVPVPLRPALDHVGDVAVALAVEAHRREHPREELPGAAHEGLALPVLLLAGALTDHHQPRVRASGAEGDGRAAPAELAARAPLERALLLAERVARVGEGSARQRDLPDAQVAVVAQRLGEPAQAVGEGLSRIVHGLG